MQAIFRHRGITVDYVPTQFIEAGTIVSVGDLIGVTGVDIPANTLGALAVVGVFDVTKKGTDAYGFGDTVYWDTALKTVVKATGAGIVKLGVAVESATLSDEAVRVRLQ